MSRLALTCLAAALCGLAVPASAARTEARCEWRKPAADPFLGDVPGAVDDYTDIPAATRGRLKARMEQRAYDDIVAIGRDAIEGRHRYEPVLLDMHFGQRRLCGEVTRKSWRPGHVERALAYCEEGHCIAVPLVCRNVSRIVRRPGPATTGRSGAPATPLEFEPPGAGLTPGAPPPEEPSSHPLLAPPPNAERLPPSVLVPPPAQPLPQFGTPGAPSVPLTPDLPPLLPPQPRWDPGWPPPGVTPLPPAPAVPEPATLLLWAAGLAALAAWRRRRAS